MNAINKMSINHKNYKFHHVMNPPAEEKGANLARAKVNPLRPGN